MIGNIPTVPKDTAGGVPVNLQDQTTKPVILNFNKVSNSTTLSALAVKGAKSITVTDTTGFADKAYVIIFDPTSLNFSFYNQIGAVAGNVVTLDTPLDYAYPIGANVDVGSTALNVNGSVTPQTFGLRGTGIPPGVELTVDITKINIQCAAASAVELEKFADLAELTNGLILRKRNEVVENLINMKTNFDIGAYMGDWVPYQKINLAQGIDGFGVTMTFAGQNNVGVAIRLKIGEDLEFIVQDNLSGITSLKAVAHGHVLQN